MAQSTLSKYDRVKVTANAHIVFINDVLTQAVMDMIQEAKSLGIFRQKRKQILNQMMAEIEKYERFIFRESGDNIGQRADQCEAFSEQVEKVKQTLVKEAEALLDSQGIEYPSYRSYIHLTRATAMASDIAIRGWAKKLVAVAFPKKADYNMYVFRQEKFNIRMQQLVSYEFGNLQDKIKESESTDKATRDFLSKMSDTDMICRIIGGEIKPSWMQEESAPVNNPDAESVNKE